MSAHISFLPLSASMLTRDVRRAPEGAAQHSSCTETTVHKLTSDPRYIVRITDARYPDGRRLRSTVYLEKASGQVIDQLNLLSEDHGRTWRVTAKGRPAAE